MAVAPTSHTVYLNDLPYRYWSIHWVLFTLVFLTDNMAGLRDSEEVVGVAVLFSFHTGVGQFTGERQTGFFYIPTYLVPIPTYVHICNYTYLPYVICFDTIGTY